MASAEPWLHPTFHTDPSTGIIARTVVRLWLATGEAVSLEDVAQALSWQTNDVRERLKRAGGRIPGCEPVPAGKSGLIEEGTSYSLTRKPRQLWEPSKESLRHVLMFPQRATQETRRTK